MLRFLMNTFSPLQIWRNTRCLLDLKKPLLLTAYLVGLPLRLMVLKSFSEFFIELLQRPYFPYLPDSAWLAVGVILIFLAILSLRNRFSGVVFVVFMGGMLLVLNSSLTMTLPIYKLLIYLFWATVFVCSYLSPPIFLQFSFIHRQAIKAPKQPEKVLYSAHHDAHDLFEYGCDVSGGQSYYNWNSD